MKNMHIETAQIELLSQLVQRGPVYGSAGQEECTDDLVYALNRNGWDEVFTQAYCSGELKSDPNYVPTESFGDEYKNDNERNKINVFGVMRGSKPGPTLLLNGHYDVEPVADPNLWNNAWDSGVKIDGRLYGRGATDMLGGLTSQLFVASALAEKRRHWGGTIIFNAVADEEIGGNGTLASLHELQRRGYLDNPTNFSCLIAEPSSRIIANESYGFMHMVLRSHGTARHLAGASSTDNAIYPMMDAIQNFDSVLANASRNLSPRTEELMHNFGVIRGGFDAATPIDQIESEATIFYPSTIKNYELGMEIEQHYAEAGMNIDVEFSDFHFDGQKSPDSALESALLSTATNADIRKGIFKSPCDARLLGAFGVNQVVIYGPGSLDQAHAANEFIELSDINEYNSHLYRALGAFLTDSV